MREADEELKINEYRPYTNDFVFLHIWPSLESLCLILVPHCSSLEELSNGMLTLGIPNIIPK